MDNRTEEEFDLCIWLAKNVMGWTYHEAWDDRWQPTNLIRQAIMIFDEMSALGWHCMVRFDADRDHTDVKYTALFNKGYVGFRGDGTTKELAICRAAKNSMEEKMKIDILIPKVKKLPVTIKKFHLMISEELEWIIKKFGEQK